MKSSIGKDLKKKRKRKFHGNRYTVVDGAKKSRADDKDSKMPNDCDSIRKLNKLPNETVKVHYNYKITINSEILKPFFDLIVSRLW